MRHSELPRILNLEEDLGLCLRVVMILYYLIIKLLNLHILVVIAHALPTLVIDKLEKTEFGNFSVLVVHEHQDIPYFHGRQLEFDL